MKNEIKAIADNLKDYAHVYIYAEKADRSANMIAYDGEHSNMFSATNNKKDSAFLFKHFLSVIMGHAFSFINQPFVIEVPIEDDPNKAALKGNDDG